MLSALLAAIARRRARSRAVAWLRRLDDRRLRDLGIEWDQIELYVYGKV